MAYSLRFRAATGGSSAALLHRCAHRTRLIPQASQKLLLHQFFHRARATIEGKNSAALIFLASRCLGPSCLVVTKTAPPRAKGDEVARCFHETRAPLYDMQNIWLNFPITRWLRIGAYTEWRVGQDAHKRCPAREKGRPDNVINVRKGNRGK